jgi:hypothetical protein
MSEDIPAAHLAEEPQQERGAPGSRDTGAAGPSGGPVERPSGTSDGDSDGSVDPQGAIDENMPDLPSGDQGG